MTLQSLLNKYEINNFTEHEIRQVSSEIPEELYENAIPTLLVIQKMREELGFPMTFNSAYRDKEKNKEVGGSKTSLHMKFNAFDTRPVSNDPYELALMQEWLLKAKYDVVYNDIAISQRHMGIGLYDTFLHIDSRGLIGYASPARWDYRNA